MQRLLIFDMVYAEMLNTADIVIAVLVLYLDEERDLDL